MIIKMIGVTKKISANTAVYRVDADYRFEHNYTVGQKTGENPCEKYPYTVHRLNI
jgi:hypothetical protein